MPQRLDIPWQIWLAASGWYLVGSALLSYGVESSGRGSVVAAVGTDVVAVGLGDAGATLALLGGLLTLVLAVLLLLGHGWAWHGLVACGVLAIVLLALTGELSAVVAMLGSAVGCAPVLGSGRALDHLGVGAR